MERVFSEHNENISNDIFSFMREEIILVLYVCFLKVNSSSCGCLWLPELRIIVCALNITCGFLLSFIENNNSQDHYLSSVL